MKTVVVAKEGLQVPRENHPRRHITQEPVEVELTTYYLRLLTAGDLIQVQARKEK